MVLEDAYRNNPKPDKQARLDIVDRVSLSEKEVQVRRTPRISEWKPTSTLNQLYNSIDHAVFLPSIVQFADRVVLIFIG